MFNITANIFLRYGSDRFHIIGMVPQFSLPQLVSFSGKRSNNFLPVIPFRYLIMAVIDSFGGADTKQ